MALWFQAKVVVVVWLCYGLEKLTWISIIISESHIDAIVRESEGNFQWRIIGFYGHPETH